MAAVAVTGIGVVTPLGLTAERNVECLHTLESGVGPLTAFAVDGSVCRSAAQAAEFDLAGELRFPKSTKFMNRPVHLGMKAALEAFRGAGLRAGSVDPEQVGLFAGAGNTCLEPGYFTGALAYAWAGGKERDFKYLGGRPARMIDRYFSLRTLANAGVGLLSNELQAKGPNANYAHSETASLMAIENAWHDITEGRCSVAVAGGYDSLVQPAAHLDFHSRGLLSKEAPPCAYRPFDRERNGIVLGEGAAFFVLESREHAERRGARVLAEIVAVDCRMTSAGELADEMLDGAGADFAVARGFGTAEEDRAEYLELQDRMSGIPVTAYKSRTGYLGAATAAVEAALGLLAAREGFVPAVAWFGEADEECTLDLVAHQARALTSRRPIGLFLCAALTGQVGGIMARAVTG